MQARQEVAGESAVNAATAAGKADLSDLVAAFRKVAEAISEDVELDAVLHIVGRECCALLDVRRCSVYLKDEEADVYRGRVGEPDPAWDESIKRLTCGTDADRFTQEIVAERRPVLITDAQHDPRPIRSAMRAWDVHSMLGVPMVERGDVTGLIFLDNGDVPHTFSDHQQEVAATFANLAGIAISQARRSAELRTNLATVARQNGLLRRSATIDERLTALVLDAAGLRDIAATVAELTHKPCAIYDAQFSRLAVGSPDPGAPAPRMLDASSRDVPEVAQALRSLDPKRPAMIGPIPAAGIAHRYLLPPVIAGEALWGYFVMMEFGGRFGPLDAAAARRSAVIIALEFAAQRRSEDAEAHAREVLLRDLIRGVDDERHTARRASFAGLALDRPHLVGLLQRRNGGSLDEDEIESAFAQLDIPHTPGAITIENGALVFLLEVDPGASRVAAVGRAKQEVDALLARIAPDADTLAALSTICVGPCDYRRAYEEARQVMHCLTNLAATTDVATLAADDLGAGRLFLAAADRGEADRFARDTLGPLLDAADPKVADLLSTLQVFFEAARSVRQTAVRLAVHENTIRYRLSRVAELTGLDVAGDADHQLAIQVALQILWLERRLPTAEIAGGSQTG